MKHFLNDECLEGVRKKVPKKWKACCDSFEHSTLACQYDIRIQYYGKKWGIPILDGGSSFKAISFCPFCGEKL